MKINKKWKAHHGMLVKVTLAFLVMVLLLCSVFKQCSQLGKSAAEKVYVPSTDDGFIMKSNLLLRHLVQQGNELHADVKPHSITDLQRRYPALLFALPYDEDAVEGARAADIRLVGIIADSISDENDRRFFYNSDIPSLLEKQRSNLGDRMFRITFSQERHLVIEKIEVLPSMFKVALDKDPWVGAITSDGNQLFTEDNHCFLTWGKSVVPIRMSEEGHLAQGGHEKVFIADENTRTLTMHKGRPIDYYALHKAYAADTTTVCVRWQGKGAPAVYLDYLSDNRLCIKTVGCYCTPYDEQGRQQPLVPMSSSMKGEIYHLMGTLKLMVSRDVSGDKLCELTVTRHNPMLLMSALLRSNAGRTRYTITPQLTDKFTRQVVQGLSSTLRNTVYQDTVHLSLDPLLSMEMERELERYATTLKSKGQFYKDDQWELSLTVMDMATGEVIAAPFYRSSDKGVDDDIAMSRKNPAFTRRFIGSTFKPLVALAAVLTKPQLAHWSSEGQYHLQGNDGKGKRKAIFMGHETTAWSDKGSAANFWGGCPSMDHFFARSDDVYPVALVAKALNYGEGAGSPFVFRNHDVMLETNDNFTWAGSRFIHTVDHLYDMPSPKEYNLHDSLQMEYYVWDGMGANVDRLGLDNVSPDPTLIYYDNFTRKGATLKTELSTWALGQGTNEWNCLKLAEAWSRMLTKRKVKTSLIRQRENVNFASLTEGYDNQAWNSVLQSLRKAQSLRDKRLLWPMDDAVRQLNTNEHIKDTLLLFSKTGTPDNYERVEWKSVRGGPRWLDVGLYCMALMPSSSYQSVRNDNGGWGLMCVMRITRIVSNHHKRLTASGNEDGIQSSDARNFFSSNPQLLRKFYHLTKSHLERPKTATQNKKSNQNRKK